jgi:beta-lactamase regulating signal transducer with metallopeptidase domain
MTMAAQLLPPLINIVGQSVAVLILALAAERVVRRRSTLRHAVLLSGLVGALAVPGVALIEQRLGIVLVSLPIDVSQPQRDPNDQSERNESAVAALTRSQAPPSSAQGIDSDSSAITTLPATGDMAVTDSLAQRVPTLRLSRVFTSSWFYVVALVWCVGSILVLFRTVTSWMALRSLRRRATVANHSVLDAALGLIRPVWQGAFPDILVSKGLRTPFSAGLLRPFVLLPEPILAMSAQEIRDVLLHEFAHVQRRDFAVVCLQRLTTVLFWPNPLLHCLNRLLDAAREDICDNFVIEAGDAVVYSRTLLSLSVYSGSGWRTGMAPCLFSSRRKLEDRIRDLLDERRNTMTRLPSSVAYSVTGVFAVLLLLLAAIRTHGHAQETPPVEGVLTPIVADAGDRQPGDVLATLDEEENGVKLMVKPRIIITDEEANGISEFVSPKIIITDEKGGGPGAAGDNTGRREGDISAPVVYRDLMLVLANNEGAAAVVFTEPTERGIGYRFRYESRDGKKVLGGTGALTEAYKGEEYVGGKLFIEAGPVRVGWSYGDERQGWIYYNPESLKVQLAHARDFEDRMEGIFGERNVVPKLNLKSFMKSGQ